MVLVERADKVRRSKASSSQHTIESTSESSWRIGLDQSGIMVHHHQENNPSRPFPPSSSSSPPPPSKSPLPPSSPPRISQGFSSPAAVGVSTGAPVQQPLGIAPPTVHTSTFKTTGLGLGAATMAAAAAAVAATVTTSLGYPFTHAQWKELETQYMIYKYMVASLPVPPDLLIPIISNLSHHSPHYSPYSFGSGLTLRYGGTTDGEPGRCKRTDGKKWRCSREVAPHQKYCDRHLHRGRPRSRKLVEVQANNGGGGAATIFGNGRAKKTRSNNNTSLVSFSGGGGGGDSLARRNDRVPLIFPDDDDNNSFLTLESSYKGTRDVDWLMIGDNPCSTSAYNPFPTSSYLGSTYYNKGQGHELFFVSDPPARSSLTLSMCGTNDDSASWVNLAAGGGPLAEALGHGIASTPSDPWSPNVARNGNDEMDSSLTARTLASLSDSSGASSPCLTASPFTKSEFTVRWSEICINPVASLFFI